MFIFLMCLMFLLLTLNLKLLKLNLSGGLGTVSTMIAVFAAAAKQPVHYQRHHGREEGNLDSGGLLYWDYDGHICSCCSAACPLMMAS